MYCMSYNDLQWRSALLEPLRYTIRDGALQRLKSPGEAPEAVCTDPKRRTASLGMPAGQGKISDAGYDQMACLFAEIPVYDHVRFRAKIRVLQYPAEEAQNGQEGIGLFFRDTMDPEPLTGYPYSNMAVGGISRGQASLFGRQGITEDSVEGVRHFRCSDEGRPDFPWIGTRLEIVLEKRGLRLSAEIGAEGAAARRVYETTVDEDVFASREHRQMALGFLAARGCRMEADLDSVRIEYRDEADGNPQEALYASPEGSPQGQGTAEDPLTLQAAVDRCLRGQEIRVLPGRYRMRDDLFISRQNSGSYRCRKKLRLENSFGKPAVLDFGGKARGLIMEGAFWEISGLTVTRGLGFIVRGSRNRISHCLAAANLETGFLIRHPSNDGPKAQWPSYNTVADCVSCLNRDRSEQHADGFACKIAAGPGNEFIRCTAWMNSDDGFDLFAKNRSIGSVRLRECRSWLNGYTLREGRMVKTKGNGNGFKLGGSGLAADHEALDCEAVGNLGFGFTSNSNPRMRLAGCRAGNNLENYAYYFTGPEAGALYSAENCAETDDPAFDPAAWAGEHILPGIADGTLLSGEDVIEALQKDQTHVRNENAIRTALKQAGELRRNADPSLPGILMMCSSFYGGGAERVACRLASGLTERYNVYFLYIQDKGQSYYLDPRIQTVAMPFFYGSWDDINACRAKYVQGLKAVLNIRTAVSFMYTMNRVNVESGGNAVIICSERNNPRKRYPERMPEIDRLYASADHVVFQSETVRSMFSPAVRAHGSIILNPVEVSCMRRGGSRRIVNVGRLVPQKNQAMLLRAFAAFYRNHGDYTLSFYGAGELLEQLQALAGSLGLKDAVQFHGQVWDVHAAIADAEMFVLSSDYEGLSNALLECMMMGFPCISTRCEGSVNVIESGKNGILTDVGSEEQLAEAMTLLADHGELRERLGVQARRSAAQFEKEPVLRQWEQLIGRLSAGAAL